MTTVVLTDFYNRFRERKASVRFARIITLLLGIISTLLACLGGLLGNILEAATKIINFFGGALVGIFLLGMLSSRAGPRGGLTGIISGFVTVLLLAGLTNISFMWYSFSGAAVTFLVGWTVSTLLNEKITKEQKALVYRRRGIKPEV